MVPVHKTQVRETFSGWRILPFGARGTGFTAMITARRRGPREADRLRVVRSVHANVYRESTARRGLLQTLERSRRIWRDLRGRVPTILRHRLAASTCDGSLR